MGTQPQHPSTSDRVREYADATGSPQASAQHPELARTATHLMAHNLNEHARAVRQSLPGDDEPDRASGPLTGAKLADLVYDAHYLADYLGIDLNDEIRRVHEERMDKIKPPTGDQLRLF